ncbi:hypothetical protein A1O1_08599 [Capronia coronata CBS 617.96]|uniref:Urea active transporter n=1 Tax=Capronia coronata CBS 617.96 TaxID=1182541 RepID=W9YDS2_9EURO|nr:uncharacterized protein A1O1_08599 [Capronia coronata CBS 617.96]EXJ80454.1 hypothetical protein A1O1_08599 [Capronia coronata CBS 617.96]
MSAVEPILGQSVGYGILCGAGAVFALGMTLVSIGLSRYFAEKQTSEMFMTAKHSVRTGLTASAVVSSWTIAATLLTSTNYGYQFGVSGPYWYGAGASVQILLFSVAAIELKRKAPNAHTFLEVVKIRYGAPAHIVLSLYSLVFQVIQSVNLLVGGSGLFANVTGMSSDAACFLFPLGVIVYTLFGGMKATFLTDWVHSVTIYMIMLVSIFTVYTTSSLVGSPARLWELLTEAAHLHAVEGNADGSYLTMKSQQGGYVGLIFIGSGFSAAVDSQLFQKAIAADPVATLPGYLLGGTCWFAIPFVLASTYGLTAAAVEHLPSFPTYPNRMSAREVATGMALPYAATTILGRGGAIAILLMVFMAVTSAMSSETMATAGLLTYDFYHAYINPNATGKQLIRFSHSVVVLFGLIIAAIACGFNHAGFSVNYLTTCIGIIVDSAIVPMACTIMWSKQSKAAVILAPLLSSAAGLAAWLGIAYTKYGAVTLTTTSENLPLAIGNVVAVVAPTVLVPLITYIKPEHFDFNRFREIKTADDANHGVARASSVISAEQEATLVASHYDDNRLRRARNWAATASVALTLCFLVLWPLPMYGSGYACVDLCFFESVFSKGFFTGWVVVCFLFAIYASGTITLLPLIEGRKSIVRFVFEVVLQRPVPGESALSEGVELDTPGSQDDGITATVGKEGEKVQIRAS